MARTRLLAVGAALTALALAGYVVGVVAPYPGRSVVIPGVMVGITLLALGGSSP